MKYKQILTEEECKGKTVDRIVQVHNNTFFVFTDKTFCVYNVNFCSGRINITSTSGSYGLYRLGFISKEAYERELAEEKMKFAKQRKANEINTLKKLIVKYPGVAKLKS